MILIVLVFLGLSNWITASVYLFVGVMFSELVLYPDQTISVRPNLHLWRLMAKS